MAASFYKWLPFSLLVYFFSIQEPANREIGTKPFAIEGEIHPFHVSTTEINHNGAEKTLEISCKIFVDDFESCLSKQYHTKTDLSAGSMKAAMDSLVKKYLLSHLLVKADGKAVVLNYLGFEKEDVAANIYLEVENVNSVKKVEVTDSILQDLYDDQINIIHVVVGGNRKSTKLDYPKKEASFSF
ncbi:MAG TPA: DUF6702 family protein [Chitinophagaceae bacterium]|nr:DUF6702 family protein [Chitinophagaceae bacterium]